MSYSLVIIALVLILPILFTFLNCDGFNGQYEGADVKFVPIHSMPALRTEGSTMLVPDSYTWADRRLRPKNDI